MVMLMVRMVIAMRDYHVASHLTEAVALDVFHVVYVVVPLLFLLHLRLAWTDSRGLWAMASIPWITKMSDTGAFFAGRQFGRLAMAPQLSPKKTWEGAMGGAVVAGLATILLFMVATPAKAQPLAEHVSGMEMVGFGLVLATAGMLGDLAESLLKRDAGRKDSSAWLPGLGGTLDVLDSILWAAPVGYFCWLLWLEQRI
jgi:phosphatidate cytidylyltransferase